MRLFYVDMSLRYYTFFFQKRLSNTCQMNFTAPCLQRHKTLRGKKMYVAVVPFSTFWRV